MHPAAPNTCGHAINVPDTMLNSSFLESPTTSEGEETGDQLAIMSTPGAIKSGYTIKQKQEG